LSDGQADFSFGVDSSRVPLIRSQFSSNGLTRTALAWLTNGTVRGGGIQTRTGFQYLCNIAPAGAIYQGGLMYDTEPLGGNSPYLMLSINGRMLQVRVDTNNAVIDVTGKFADPPNALKAYFVQGEQFMVKQAGDGQTLPLFWDGTKLRRSNGITGNLTGPNINELPPATAMSYYQGRIFYAQNRLLSGGDIAGDTNSGTAQYNFIDSILRVTENPLALGGDGFNLPAMAGNIRAITYPISLDTTFGEGPLFIFTAKQIYALTVPITRTDWIAANSSTQPLLRVVMNSNGTSSDRSVVSVNGDLFYQSLDPAIRSFFMALRYFQGWGNTVISNNLNRVLAFNDRSLMNFASGITFGNRLYQAILPINTKSGAVFQGIAIMDLDPVSTLQEQKPPAWDGMYEGLNVLQMFVGNFGGRERAFAVIQSRIDSTLQVWEITDFQTSDFTQPGSPGTIDNRIQMYIEFPAIDFSTYSRANGGGPFERKRLDGFDLWLDKAFGTVDVKLQYRVDEDPCIYDWGTQQICIARDCRENASTPCAYPIQFRQGYKIPMTFGPNFKVTCGVLNNRPTNIGYKFQPIITTKGFCRIRGYHIHGIHVETPPYDTSVC
jgi:hypothetical protein